VDGGNMRYNRAIPNESHYGLDKEVDIDDG